MLPHGVTGLVSLGAVFLAGLAAKFGLTFEPMRTSFFLSRRNGLEARKSKIPSWQNGRARNANDASRYFQLPTNRVVELRTQFSI
jgi:KUP system potassium uptake protein